jgi:mono/diheme cytochrome c family protein
VDNSSFCSNSACHGTVWEFAGFDAPGLREILMEQIPAEPTPIATEEAPLTYEAIIGLLLDQRCGACHGEGGLQGLNLTSYEAILKGGISGAAILPGEPDHSLLIQVQSGEQAHFGQLNPEELELVKEWIRAGAP